MSEYISSKELSEYLEISQRRVQQLANEKILIKDTRNSFALKENVKRYIRYISPTFKNDDQEQALKHEELNVIYKKEKIRLTKYQADEQEVKAQLAQKRVVVVDDVISALADLFSLMRTKLFNIPERAEMEILGETDADIFNKKLTAEIKDALYEICEHEEQTLQNIVVGKGEN
ncbi:hypothetical protein [Francisella philomiragia]|uniref:Phage DNA packaging Nu1 family protein n=1 Tax=Francisella philomiragia TaxID=28110 RepID=A0ABS1GCX7_9GAMM|nr:hypothetical protein [Francisella philomiragia]MBK2259007.1 hypothetical protein [Francisella philomiragia]MBK2302698.1 hypothetical protein [Francisella philomiragia]